MVYFLSLFTSSLLDPRIAYTQLALYVATALAPGFYAIHNVSALEPEEDVLLMGRKFIRRKTFPTM